MGAAKKRARSGGSARSLRASATTKRGGSAKGSVKPAARSTRSEDERYFVVDGRRWRRSDPSIPETFRAELVRELMSARRAVLAAKRTDDASAEKVARARVNDAKVALGERGRPYWEALEASAQKKRAAAVARALLSGRGTDKTICPSDIARVIGGEEWRAAMPQVRAFANEWVEQGELEMRQKGRKVSDPRKAKGAIRLAVAPRK